MPHLRSTPIVEDSRPVGRGAEAGLETNASPLPADPPRLGQDRQTAILNMQQTFGNTAVQRFVEQATAGPSTEPDDSLARDIRGASGSGAPFDPGVRARLEDGLGSDLSSARVHTDAQADALARRVNAVAFTTGDHIFFRSGAYAPASDDGLELVAHEAAHVVQQAQGPVAGSPSSGGIQLSDPTDVNERAADGLADQVVQRRASSDEPRVPSRSASSAPTGQVAVQRDADDSASTASAATDPAVQAEINPEDIWREVEPQARTELLAKLQEIAAAAGEQTRAQLETLFGPYEDGLQSDAIFASYASIGPWAAGGAVGAGGMVAGGLAGGAAQGVSAAFNHIMTTNRVAEAKERARADVGGMVRSQVTSSSDLYNNFEATALDEIRREFDDSWAQLNPSMKQASQAEVTKPFYIAWFRGIARSKYGTDSPDAVAALADIKQQVETAFGPVKVKLDEIKSDQEKKRIGVGAAGGALLGATIGTMIAPGLGTAIGAGIGAIGGAIAGWLW